VSTSSKHEAVTTKGFIHALAAPLTASKVALACTEKTVHFCKTPEYTELNAWWLEGLLHIHYILLLTLCHSCLSP